MGAVADDMANITMQALERSRTEVSSVCVTNGAVRGESRGNVQSMDWENHRAQSTLESRLEQIDSANRPYTEDCVVPRCIV